MKRILLIFFLCIRVGAPLSGQDNPPPRKSALFFAGGVTIVDYQDLVFSESIYEGSGLSSIEMGYLRHGSRSVIKARLSYAATEVAPRYLISSGAFGQREASSFSQISLDLSYVWQMLEVSGLKGYAGLQLQAQYQERFLIQK